MSSLKIWRFINNKAIKKINMTKIDKTKLI